VIPSAIHISVAEELKNRLIPALEKLHGALEAKAKEFWDIIKIGRTHLMDATPIRLGQEFSGYAQQVGYAKEHAQKSIEVLREVTLGGTAVETGLNRHIDLPKKMLRHLEQRIGIAFSRRKIISKRKAERTQWSKRADWLPKTLNLCARKKSKFEIPSTATSSSHSDLCHVEPSRDISQSFPEFSQSSLSGSR
jgi:aspartate ammonia-lyase